MLPSWIPHKNPNFGNLEALEQESEISEKCTSKTMGLNKIQNLNSAFGQPALQFYLPEAMLN